VILRGSVILMRKGSMIVRMFFLPESWIHDPPARAARTGRSERSKTQPVASEFLPRHLLRRTWCGGIVRMGKLNLGMAP
jgi:hypothetical protein